MANENDIGPEEEINHLQLMDVPESNVINYIEDELIHISDLHISIGIPSNGKPSRCSPIKLYDNDTKLIPTTQQINKTLEKNVYDSVSLTSDSLGKLNLEFKQFSKIEKNMRMLSITI